VTASRKSSATALAVMARYPALGKVKTRLAATIGAQRALDLYRAFLLDLDERFSDGDFQLVWMYAPAAAPFSALMRSSSICLPQEGVDLGERMRRCFEVLLESESTRFTRVVMIGSDVPHIRGEAIDEAARRLDDHDVVIGPSDDGGYYLIGLRRPHDLFSTVDMGTPLVLEQTLRAVRAAGLTLHQLPVDFDVDEESDLTRLRSLLREAGAPRLSRTMAVLAADG
jgi:rSAM/selenodomain-associated transferase 1